MIHDKRRFSVKWDATVEDIAALGSEGYTLCGCAGFAITEGGITHLLLNDAFSANGAQEYALCLLIGRDGDTYAVRQIDSITLSWMTEARIREALPGWLEMWKTPEPWHGRPFLITADTHGYATGNPCHLCA